MIGSALILAALAFTAAPAAEGDLAAILDVPGVDAESFDPACPYWFTEDDDGAFGERYDYTCSSPETAEDANIMAFRIWGNLEKLGWQDLTGGANALWGRDASTCRQATVAVFSTEGRSFDIVTPDTRYVVLVSVNRNNGCPEAGE
ncbi:MAG: hypothetical protein AAGH41_04655 [Pseudomonadota bacterium]